jgi:hypothetical protein
MTRYRNYLGIDVGIVSDPTALVLVRVETPDVIVRERKLYDARTGEPVSPPEGMTPAEYVMPRYLVRDAQSVVGLSFRQLAREVRGVHRDLGGDVLAVIDATGVEEVRNWGVPVLAVNLTGGSRITGGPRRWNVPTATLWTTLYTVMAQDRLAIFSDIEHLADELRSIERRVSDAGRESYDLDRTSDGHSDQAVALALAVCVAESAASRRVRSLQVPEGRPARRTSGRRLIRDAARARIEELRQERMANYFATGGERWRPMTIGNITTPIRRARLLDLDE